MLGLRYAIRGNPEMVSSPHEAGIQSRLATTWVLGIIVMQPLGGLMDHPGNPICSNLIEVGDAVVMGEVYYHVNDCHPRSSLLVVLSRDYAAAWVIPVNKWF
jgi:hypothetical protein